MISDSGSEKYHTAIIKKAHRFRERPLFLARFWVADFFYFALHIENNSMTNNYEMCAGSWMICRCENRKL